MDPLASDSASSAPATLDSLDRDFRALRLTVQIMLISLVILSGALGLYIFRQVSLVRRQAENTLRVAQQMALHFNTTIATQAVAFENLLLEYSRTNPAFQARLSRFYNTSNAASPSASPDLDSKPSQPGPP